MTIEVERAYNENTEEQETAAAADNPNTTTTTTNNNNAISSTSHQLSRQLSVSETVEASNGGSRAPIYLKWLEIPFSVPNPVTGQRLAETCGWGMDSAARGPLNLVGTWMGAAILRMAIQDAGGPDETVKGWLKPSSLLTAATSLVGVIAAILMPVFGAVVDHTKYRRLVGIVSGMFAVVFIGMQIFISVEKNNWLFILVVDLLQSFAMLVHVAAVFAYLPELSTDENVMSHYTSRLHFRQQAVLVTYTALVLITTNARGNGDSKLLTATVQTARDAAGIAFGLGTIFFGYSWAFLFTDRPALSHVPAGQNLLTTGFVQVRNTSRKIWNDYRALKWFMISLLWSPEAGAGVILSIIVTYLTVVVKFSGQDLGKTTITLLAANMVGSIFSKFCCRMVNPLNSYRMGLLSLGVSIGLGAYLLEGPEDREIVFGLAATWGFGMGWTYPSQRVLFCTLIPKGQETEIMGLFTFTGQILGWLPPFIVTLMNENDYDRKWSLVLIFCFCSFAVINTLPMGNYREACDLVARDSEEKLRMVLEAAANQAKSNRKGEPVTSSSFTAQVSLTTMEAGESEMAAAAPNEKATLSEE